MPDMARVVLLGKVAARWRRQRATFESTRATTKPDVVGAAPGHSTVCLLCGAQVTPDGSGHATDCRGMG